MLAALHFIILTKEQPLISVQWIGVVITDQLPKQSTHIKVNQLIFYPLTHSLTPWIHWNNQWVVKSSAPYTPARRSPRLFFNYFQTK